MVRPARFSGSFYPADPTELERVVRECLDPASEKVNALAVIVPHAGYIYSGKVAGAVFSRLQLPPRILLLSPNHTGLGARVAVFASEAWETPLGKVMVDQAFCRQLADRLAFAELDDSAHAQEHSLEVQLPFLQLLNPQAKIVPITLQHPSLREIQTLARVVAELIGEEKGQTLILASSDMNHYESAVVGKQKDEKAIAKVLALDPAGLLQTVAANQISMCGVIPSAAAIETATKLGAKEAVLVAYSNSGERTGDFVQVVGYAGFTIS